MIGGLDDAEAVDGVHVVHAGTAEAGLSLGDRFCLALARRDGLPAWTSDQNWKKIADAVEVKVVTIR